MGDDIGDPHRWVHTGDGKWCTLGTQTGGCTLGVFTENSCPDAWGAHWELDSTKQSQKLGVHPGHGPQCAPLRRLVRARFGGPICKGDSGAPGGAKAADRESDDPGESEGSRQGRKGEDQSLARGHGRREAETGGERDKK